MLSVFILIESIWPQIWPTPLPCPLNENGPLPVDVRRSNTPLLKLPRRGGAGEEYEYTTEIQASFKRIKRDPLSGMLLSSLALNMVLVVG